MDYNYLSGDWNVRSPGAARAALCRGPTDAVVAARKGAAGSSIDGGPIGVRQLGRRYRSFGILGDRIGKATAFDSTATGRSRRSVGEASHQFGRTQPRADYPSAARLPFSKTRSDRMQNRAAVTLFLN